MAKHKPKMKPKALHAPKPAARPTPKPPVDNSALVQAITALHQQNTPENLNAALNTLVRAALLVPVAFAPGTELPKPDAQGRVAIPKDAKFAFPLLSDAEQRKFFMAYTGPQALRAWKTDTPPQTVLLRFDDLAALLQRNPDAAGFVVDPFSGSLRLTREMVQSIQQQRAAQQKPAGAIRPGENVTLVEPTVLPDELLDPVCAVLAEAPDIAAAYLQLLIRDGGTAGYLVVLDGPADRPLLDRVAAAAKPFLQDNPKKMDLSITTSASPLGRQGMHDSEPFYRRGEGRVYDEDDEE